ncbi:MAG: hypothetical protein ACTSRG_02620 [Candidatus Helarchaeota archaeon]
MENILSRISVKNEPNKVQKGLNEISSYIKNLKNSYNAEYSNVEIINRAKLIDKMEQVLMKFRQTGSFQPVADLLPMIKVKIKKYIKTPKMFFEAKKEKSIRLRSAERMIKSVISDKEALEDLKVCVDSLMNMPSDYGPAIEGVFYGELKDENDPEILGRQMGILNPFLKNLSEIDQDEITELLKKYKEYRSVAEMVKHIIEETKCGNIHILDSKDKILKYFFPEKINVGTIKADPIAIIYEKKLLDPQNSENLTTIAQKVLDKFNALASFLSVSLQAIMGREELQNLQKEIEKIGVAISTGTKLTMLTNRLKRETTEDEYINTLTELEKHLNELVGKINQEITPAFAKNKLGEWIMEYQREVIEKGGINISELSRTASIDTLKHIERKREILRQFENDSAIEYIKLKAQEVKTSTFNLDIIEKAAKLFAELKQDNGWIGEPTPNELPLYNASLGLLIKSIKELEKEKDILLNELANITKKSISGAMYIPIIPGIRNETHPTSAAVGQFISALQWITNELEEIKDLIKNFSMLSQKMTIANKKLPAMFMEDPKYLKEPLTFIELLEKEQKKLIAQKDSMAIEEEEFKKRLEAFDYVKKMLETLNNIYPEYRKIMADQLWLDDIFKS